MSNLTKNLKKHYTKMVVMAAQAILLLYALLLTLTKLQQNTTQMAIAAIIILATFLLIDHLTNKKLNKKEPPQMTQEETRKYTITTSITSLTIATALYLTAMHYTNNDKTILAAITIITVTKEASRWYSYHKQKKKMQEIKKTIQEKSIEPEPIEV